MAVAATARLLTAATIKGAARTFNVAASALRAICVVESGGTGYLPDGRLKILLEGHKLWKALKLRDISPLRLAAAVPSCCFPSWTTRWYKGGAGEWERVARVLAWASKNDAARFESYKKAVYESCSWGMFQLMGGNYHAAGFPDVYALKHALEQSEAAQLNAILLWMDHEGLLRKLRAGDLRGFVRGYNGAGQVSVYFARLTRAMRRAVQEGF